ncbi:MAG: protease SohB [Endozoicomonadaceae bacterium]|nr:protease SohB [Endozoicomonadaceae bacterium]
MSYWAEIGLFVGKTAIIVIAVFAIVTIIASAAQKAKGMIAQGCLSVKHLNKTLDDAKNILRTTVIPKAELKQILKSEHKKEKQKEKQKNDHQKSIYVIDFKGDMKASSAKNLSEEVSAILSIAKKNDEVLVRLESPGGIVHGYGFAMSQLERIIKNDIRLVIAVDKVAASGGYMMACVANHIIAAPFAVIGSIGVIAQLPNINRLLKNNNIDIEQHTAGEYKRTLTVLGENTEKGRKKFLEDLERTHVLFKQHVEKYRKQADIDKIATGEIWYGQEAIEKKLIDELGTSAEYLFTQMNKNTNVYQVNWKEKKKGILQKFGKGVENTTLKVVDNLWEKMTNRFF